MMLQASQQAFFQRRILFILALLAVVFLPGEAGPARRLSLQERIDAQRAIDRVYHAHQIGADRPFDQAVPLAASEHKVRTYLKQSAALEAIWNVPVTAEALQAELERIARNTRFPHRLRDVYGALNQDPLLVLECFVRPVLVDRLARSFFSHDRANNKQNHIYF